MSKPTSIPQQTTPTHEPGNRIAEEKLRSLLARAKQQAMNAKPGKEESLWLLTEATLEDMLNNRAGDRQRPLK